MIKLQVDSKGEVNVDLHIAYLGDREDGDIILWSYKTMKKLVGKIQHSVKDFLPFTRGYGLDTAFWS